MSNYYTYDQFEKARKESGYHFSDADLALAKYNPDAGMTILQYKKDYVNATTDEARAMAHQGAEALRRKYAGYTGGDDGTGFYIDPNAAPTYKDSYADKKKELMDAILNRKDFSYDASKDPAAQSYEKAYAREGKRATENVMASAAAATGGMPSSYAVSAAAQAGNQYAAKMADKIPELEQMAYNRYLQDLNLKHNDLQMVNGASKTEYGQYLDALNQYNNDRNYDHMKEQSKLDREYQQRQETLKMALIKAENGDFSGLKELGVDTSAMESRMAAASSGGSGGGGGYSSSYYSAGGDDDDSGSYSSGGISSTDIDSLLMRYPDGKIPSGEWNALESRYGADTLRQMGFQRKLAGGGGGRGTGVSNIELSMR